MQTHERLRLVLKRLKLAQTDLIKLGAGSSQTISNIFHGKQKPNYILLETLFGNYKNINARWLITGEGEMLEEPKTKQEQPADFGKDLPRLLMEKSEECGVLKTRLEQCEEELAKFRARGSGRESDGQDVRAG